MSKIEFLNMDLDIESEENIDSIIEEFGDHVSIMRNEKENNLFYASFETFLNEENDIIEKYVSLINSLSPLTRKIWDKCIKKEFDFGYESGIVPNNFHSRINTNSVAQLASVGGNISITIYPLVGSNT